LEDEEKVLVWLEHQVKSDEIEDITDEMLDMLIEKMPHVAVLFCECYFIFISIVITKMSSQCYVLKCYTLVRIALCASAG
jgi:predicted transcriptional regulator